MNRCRPADVGEFALWYLRRDYTKARAEGRTADPAPPDAASAISRMRSSHPGKWRDWFETAEWSISTLDYGEFCRLIFLDSEWTRSERLTLDDGPNYRLLRRVAHRAIDTGYLSRARDDRHRRYESKILAGFRLTGEQRIAICSPHDEQVRNPEGDWYLLDGAGRSLPYMMLLERDVLTYEPVEAFVAPSLLWAAADLMG